MPETKPKTDAEQLREIAVWLPHNGFPHAMECHRLLAIADRMERLEAARNAVQAHYDQRGDDRCHLDDAKLYHDALGIEPDPYVSALPPDADMEESCRRYVRQRQAPGVHGEHPMPGRMTIAQLTAEVERLREIERAAAESLIYMRSIGSTLVQLDRTFENALEPLSAAIEPRPESAS